MEDEHSTICAVDIAGFGGTFRTRAHHVALREGMYSSVEQAFLQSGIPLEKCYQEGAGDSVLTLAPADVGKGAFAEKLPLALVSALQGHNETHKPEEWIRMRMVLHAGEITRDDRGVTGPAIVHAFRLLDSPPLKDALRDSTGVLAIMASAWFHDEVIRHRPEYSPEEYEQVAVDVKETNGFGWIRLPDDERRERTRPGQMVPSAPAVVAEPVTLTPVVQPASPEFYEVVDAIEAIPCMQGEHSRSLVVEQLRFAGSVRYFANRRAHVTSILRTCLDFEDGIVQLVTAISSQEPSGSMPMNRLLALLTRAA